MSDLLDNTTESTPLLPGADVEGLSRAPSPTPTATAPRLSARHRATIVISLTLLLAVLCLAQYTLSMPTAQALELALCRRMHPDAFAAGAVPDDSTDNPCKANDVQAALSALQGWKQAGEMLPGLLTAVSYGYLAERKGKQWMLSLALVGTLCMSYWDMIVCCFSDYIPVELCLFGPLFTFVGGGGTVVTAMIMGTIASVVSDEWRTTAFMCIGAFNRTAMIIANPAAYFLLKRGPIFAMIVGNVILTIGVLSSFAFPETTQPVVPATPSASFTLSSLHPVKLWADAVTTTRQLVATLRDITFSHPQVGLLLAVELFTILNSSSQSMIIVQYVSKRFGWTFAEAGLIVSAEAGIGLFFLVVVFPVLGFWMTNIRGLSAIEKDLWLCRATIMIQAMGALVIGLAPNIKFLVFGIVLTAVGTGYTSASRSLMTSLMQGKEIGVLFTTAVTLDTTGAIVFSPLVAYTFNLGLKLGTSWYGLPYILAGAFCVLSTAIVVYIDLPELPKQTEDSEE